MMAARASGRQHKGSSMPRNAEATASQDLPDSTSDADLSCLEEGGWEKDSPASTVMPTLRVDTRTGAPTCSSERPPLRRSRPGRSSLCSTSLREENIDVLQKMLRAEGKFQPRVDPSKGGRALCHSTSPFVAERRRWFVAWEMMTFRPEVDTYSQLIVCMCRKIHLHPDARKGKLQNQMATFLGYSRDTVAVALNYFDRYTCSRPCSPTLAQAVAATALHVAAKFEETNPASLRQLLKFTPVFTPQQLLAMEMSMLKVLNWDLRPVTIYDFVRAFCDLIPGTSGTPTSLGTRRDENEVDELRVGAEEIADLSTCEIAVLEFLPSTLAISSLLLSASRPEAVASHEDVLDMCASVGIVALDRVLQCVRLLGSSLAKRYPAASAAAGIAAEYLARYVGMDPAESRSKLAGSSYSTSCSGKGAKKAGSGRKASASGTVMDDGSRNGDTASPLPALKKRRCSTPTGVDGIVHIEMAAIRTASVKGSSTAAAATGASGSEDHDGCQGSEVPLRSANGEVEASVSGAATGCEVGGCGNAVTIGRKDPATVNRPRPTLSSASLAACQSRGGFSFPEDDTRFASLPKHRRMGYSSTSTLSSCAQDELVMTGSRKRSAEVLGHCESGSGFGAPVLRPNRAVVRTSG